MPREVFVFGISGEEYGINVSNVKEVIKMEDVKITSLPESEDFLRGITNVRGKVVPLLNLKHRFNIEGTEEQFIVLTEIAGAISGIIVDDVEDVIRIDEARIKEAPELLRDEIHGDYVEDVALLEDERMIILLNLEEGFSEEETAEIGQMADEENEEEETEEVSEEKIMEKTREKVEQ